ncbi:MAG: hypothetical protein CSA11_03645 [Chloroflexi bacterium]|nr:MAG: hypothetical protein CSA11_03645 [Chloroflexota bacterium]
MPRKKQSRGTCTFCGKEMTRGGLSKHLRSCPQRQEAIAATDGGKIGQTQAIYHLLVQDAYSSDFWLHLEANGQAKLTDIDNYLRAIWLECCGHMSQFSIGGWSGREIDMDHNVEAVFMVGTQLTHIYDFGTSSETLLKCVAVRQGKPLTTHPIYLMARNNMPEAICAECDAKAGWYCMDCLIEQNEWLNLCAAHLDKHNHNQYGGPMPLINSPRLGMCGYDGPAEPPY